MGRAGGQRRRRAPDPAEALELRQDVFAELHLGRGVSLGFIARAFGKSSEQVRLDVRAADVRRRRPGQGTV